MRSLGVIKAPRLLSCLARLAPLQWAAELLLKLRPGELGARCWERFRTPSAMGYRPPSTARWHITASAVCPPTDSQRVWESPLVPTRSHGAHLCIGPTMFGPGARRPMCGLSSEAEHPSLELEMMQQLFPLPQTPPPALKAGCSSRHPAWSKAVSGHPRLHHRGRKGVRTPWVSLFPKYPSYPSLGQHRNHSSEQRMFPRCEDPTGTPVVWGWALEPVGHPNLCPEPARRRRWLGRGNCLGGREGDRLSLHRAPKPC